MRGLTRCIDAALDEDIGSGDITTDAIIAESLAAAGVVRVKEDAVVAGLPVAEQVFHRVDPGIRMTCSVHDGDRVRKGTIIARVSGRASSILIAERTALNFLMRMSGIATVTRRYLQELRGTGVVLLDTRKTAPGLRMTDKYAVRAGGGTNHRFGLFDGILIKDNHIKAAGSVASAVRSIRGVRPYQKIEIEVKNKEELREAIRAGADIVLLDNMDPGMLKESLSIARGKILTEVSGNITLENIRAVAGAGPDFISTGAITHSAKAIDISMKLTNLYKKERP